MKNIKYLAVLALGLIACEAEVDNPIADGGYYTAGNVDLSNYVAVGNSLTAGYADGALYTAGQNNSYPNMMANRFALTGGGSFTQPMVSDNLGGLLMGGTQIAETRLVLSGTSQANLAPIRKAGTPSTDITNVLSGNFNNMGVPGAKSFHLLSNTYGNISSLPAANPYFIRFASSPSATIIGDAVAQNPTFFSLWIGNNDILSFATSGGTGVDHNATGNMTPSTYGPNDITHNTVFAGTYQSLLSQLTANGAKGVIMNIASITSIPYFTTVPYAPLDPTNPDFGPQIPTLNDIFGQLNNVYAFLGVPERSIIFSQTSASAVVIEDEDLVDMSAQITAVFNASPSFVPFVVSLGLPAAAAPAVANLLGTTYGQSRQANSNDFVVLPSSSVIGTINTTVASNLEAQGLPPTMAAQFATEGITLPLEDKWVLTENEAAMVSTAQAAYNATIAGLASANPDVIMVDAEAILAQTSNGGVAYDGGVITSTYGSGGGFSLDGVHPTARGYSLIANAAIKKMNMTFGGTIPMVNPGTYPTVYVD